MAGRISWFLGDGFAHFPCITEVFFPDGGEGQFARWRLHSRGATHFSGTARLLVSHYQAWEGKGLPAAGALVRAVLGVGLDVLLVVLQLLHGEAALLAGEPPRTRVDHLVDVEVGLVEEGLAADVTGELVGVDLVSGQLVIGHKCVVAVDAADHGVRILAGSGTVVGLEGREERVGVATPTAAVGHGPALNPPPANLLLRDLQQQVAGALPRVGVLGPHVVVHGVVAGEGAVAVLALNAGPLWVVDLHVANQFVGSVEVLVAHNTRKLLLGLPSFVDVQEGLEVDLPVRSARSRTSLLVTTDGVREGIDGARVAALDEVLEVAGVDILLWVVTKVLEERSSIFELDSADLADDWWKFPPPVSL